MAATKEMVSIALRIRPDQVTLVPEKRQELTTEGGLSVLPNFRRLQGVIEKLQAKGLPVSLFIDPSPVVVEASSRLGATFIELHTGRYSQAFRAHKGVQREFLALVAGARLGQSLGLKVHAGHGLTYQNVAPVAALPVIEDLNIGHNIIARASLVGLKEAVREMLVILRKS
jgi:pyridoxine 5-phosphate synthase